MCCFDHVERPQPDNLLSFMMCELVFLEYHSQIASYTYSFASYSYSCKLLQPYVAATAQIHSDVVFSSFGASRNKIVLKNSCSSTNSSPL